MKDSECVLILITFQQLSPLEKKGQVKREEGSWAEDKWEWNRFFTIALLTLSWISTLSAPLVFPTDYHSLCAVYVHVPYGAI